MLDGRFMEGTKSLKEAGLSLSEDPHEEMAIPDGPCPSRRDRGVYGSLESFCLGLLRDARKNAKQRDLSFNLEIGHLLQLWKEQNGRCALSGLPMCHLPKEHAVDMKDRRMRNVSIDRIDNGKGYEVGNVQLAASAVNVSRGRLSMEDFVFVCGAVYNRHGPKERVVLESIFTAESVEFEMRLK
jgi:hypothetical protein